MKDGGFAVTGVLLVMLFSASVMAGSNVEYGGKLYQFRESDSAGSSSDASGSKHKFRPLRDSGSRGSTGRNIGGAWENSQGYVFRPLRNRRRWAPGSEQDQLEDVQACPAIEEEPKQKFSSPAYTPHRSRQRYQGDYVAPLPPPPPPPGGYLGPTPDVSDYPYW